ncbi:MAG: hypothetical protein RMM31_06685 [Anaerolineae bacterium]|nr:hypothetical protein [Thermoflexales bacterium]MDW8395910.1 hypothetical protein [Anaerolineae bacterium]
MRLDYLLWWVLVYGLFPIALGSLVALPFWLKRRMVVGSAAGSAAIAIVMTALILQFLVSALSESALLDTQAWLLPMGALVVAGWVDVLVMFFIGGFVESRVRSRVVRPDDI